jgi:uncharacterized protein (TIGR00369 family)
MADNSLEEQIRSRMRDGAFAKWFGLELVSLGDGTSEVRLELQPHHLNPGGIAHGGVIASLLDSAIGLAHRTKLGLDVSHVTIELKINYLRAAWPGTIVARGTAVSSGQRVGYGEATLTDEAGETLARASATFLVVRGQGDLAPLDGE